MLCDEMAISYLELDRAGKIAGYDEFITTSEQVHEWQERDGVIDARKILGAIVVVYNSDINVPEGCYNLHSIGRAAEYDPFTQTCFIDLADSIDPIKQTVNPPSLSWALKHELRHHIVTQCDEDYSIKHHVRGRRCVDFKYLKRYHRNELVELSYLDELHSQYFDAIEDGKSTSFDAITSTIITLACTGSHLEAATREKNIRSLVRELFYYLQGMILLSRMLTESSEDHDKLISCVYVVGVFLATERSIEHAHAKVLEVWKETVSSPRLRTEFNKFLNSYRPIEKCNEPKITPKLRVILGV